jgi:predicted methyltransferase
MKALITGAGGFVGHHLQRHLEDCGDEVIATDRMTDGLDILDAAALLDLFRRTQPEVVYHLAGASDVGGSWQTPQATFRANAEGTLNVLWAARESGTGRVLTVGSADVYGKVNVVNWGAVSRTLPAASYDFILTGRSIHGWMQDKPGTVEATFKEFYKALKPGGVLAIEQHRAAPSAYGKEDPASGYVSERFVIEQAQKAGFVLAGKSEINANPKDTKDHPFGVWTLPPSLRSTAYGSGKEEDLSFDKSKYIAIGESDRMTLKFIKQ